MFNWMFSTFLLNWQLFKKWTVIKKKFHGEKTLVIPSSWMSCYLKRDKKHLDKELLAIEIKLLSSVGYWLILLQRITGIGRKTALMLVVLTEVFNKFDTSLQCCSYVGIFPTIWLCGNSVRGQISISKLENSV